MHPFHIGTVIASFLSRYYFKQFWNRQVIDVGEPCCLKGLTSREHQHDTYIATRVPPLIIDPLLQTYDHRASHKHRTSLRVDSPCELLSSRMTCSFGVQGAGSFLEHDSSVHAVKDVAQNQWLSSAHLRSFAMVREIAVSHILCCAPTPTSKAQGNSIERTFAPRCKLNRRQRTE